MSSFQQTFLLLINVYCQLLREVPYPVPCLLGIAKCIHMLKSEPPLFSVPTPGPILACLIAFQFRSLHDPNRISFPAFPRSLQLTQDSNGF
jgi:hypothetical protein